MNSLNRTNRENMCSERSRFRAGAKIIIIVTVIIIISSRESGNCKINSQIDESFLSISYVRSRTIIAQRPGLFGAPYINRPLVRFLTIRKFVSQFIYAPTSNLDRLPCATYHMSKFRNRKLMRYVLTNMQTGSNKKPVIVN